MYTIGSKFHIIPAWVNINTSHYITEHEIDGPQPGAGAYIFTFYDFKCDEIRLMVIKTNNQLEQTITLI